MAALFCAWLTLFAGCELAYPEVAVVNQTGDHILLKNVSFNGCVWDTVLAHGEATSPAWCLPGEDRVHFQKFDTASYCQEQAENGTIDDLCLCDPDPGDGVDGGVDTSLINEAPNWFNYQTVSIKRVGYGSFHLFEIRLDDIEQDFSVPGPYGH